MCGLHLFSKCPADLILEGETADRQLLVPLEKTKRSVMAASVPHDVRKLAPSETFASFSSGSGRRKSLFDAVPGRSTAHRATVLPPSYGCQQQGFALLTETRPLD